MAQDETIERRFPVRAPARLSVQNIRGIVEIEPGADDEIRVTAIKHLETGDAARTEVEMIQAADGSVMLATRCQEKLLLGAKPCKVSYRVRVPRECAVALKCISSDATLRGLHGDFTLGTVSGDLRLEALTGTVTVKSVSGDIVGAGLVGHLRLETISGDARLTSAAIPSMEAATVSGDLALASTLGAGPYRMRTVSGDFALTLPAGSGCQIEMQSLSGRLRTDAGTPTRQRGRQMVTRHGGGPAVRFQSFSGDLDVAFAAEEAATPPRHQPVVGERPHVEASRPAAASILADLAAGQINPAEAAHRLAGG